MSTSRNTKISIDSFQSLKLASMSFFGRLYTSSCTYEIECDLALVFWLFTASLFRAVLQLRSNPTPVVPPCHNAFELTPYDFNYVSIHAYMFCRIPLSPELRQFWGSIAMWCIYGIDARSLFCLLARRSCSITRRETYVLHFHVPSIR